MILQDLLDRLTYGELSTIAIGGKEHGGVQQKHMKEVLMHVEAALTAIYKRFPIRTKEVLIQCSARIQTYHLHSKHSWLSGSHRDKYIIDSDSHPFLDDVLLVNNIYDELGREVWMNDSSKYWSINMISDLSFQIPYPDDENALSVIYKASPEKFPKLVDPSTYEVDIPHTYMEPLLLYIASRVFSAVTRDGTNEGMAYMARYEQSCERVLHDGLVITDNTQDDKFENRGWI